MKVMEPSQMPLCLLPYLKWQLARSRYGGSRRDEVMKKIPGRKGRPGPHP